MSCRIGDGKENDDDLEGDTGLDEELESPVIVSCAWRSLLSASSEYSEKRSDLSGTVLVVIMTPLGT